MRDPVICADGQTYERSAIARWFREGHRTSPVSNDLLSHTNVVPNVQLRQIIATLAGPPRPPTPPRPQPALWIRWGPGELASVTMDPTASPLPHHVVILLDVSDSMQLPAEHVLPDVSRMQLVLHGLRAMFATLDRTKDTVSIVTFGSRSEVVLERRHCDGGLDEVISGLDVGGGSTDHMLGLTEACELAVKHADRETHATTVVMITDGEPEKRASPVEALRRRFGWAFGSGLLRLFVCGVGEEGESTELSALAELGRGCFVHCHSGVELVHLAAALSSAAETDVRAEGVYVGALRAGQRKFFRCAREPGPLAGRMGATEAAEARVWAALSAGEGVGSSRAESARADAHYRRWGRDYLRSLASIHAQQEVLLPQEVALQAYSDPALEALLARGWEAFGSVRAPRTIPRWSYAAGGYVRSPAPDMRALLRTNGGCFVAGSMVRVFGGRCTPIEELVNTQLLKGGSKVECVVVGRYTGVVYRGQGVVATPTHPVRPPGARQWAFPRDLPELFAETWVEDAAVYSLLLSRGQTHFESSEGLDCIALGHGITDDPVAAHGFLGTDAVRAALEASPGWEDRRVVTRGLLRDKDGGVIGFA